MHPQNPFIKDYDFDALVHHYPALKQHVFVNEYENKTIKYGNPSAVKALNSALLKAHYNIDWDIPEYNLCPPIPGRLDYLLYIHDLVNRSDIRLLDIGTGANLIYLILATCHFHWRCTGSEVDIDALKNAQDIISKNPILSDIELRHQKFKNKILEHIIQPSDKFDVVVCNPPFYKSLRDAVLNNQRKVKNLKLREKDNKNFGGQANELWYKGGEEAFIKKMIMESIQFKNQVHWFTSLISKKDNLPPIKRAIHKIHPTQVKVINMELGNKKSRFIAWSFH